LLTIPARAVVLASGGLGHLYAVTTNPSEARGHGLAIAARAGAMIADPEFVQFHPTAIDIGRDPAPLATEAIRGEGAWLINRAGERFMLNIHREAELAPRDIVARGVFAELQAGRGRFLDARKAIGASFAQRFPAWPNTAAAPASTRRASRSRWPRRPLPHGRRRDRCARPHLARRACGGRRSRRDRRAWRQSPGLQLAARSGGLCGAHRRTTLRDFRRRASRT
jgi:hypothetical protein